MSKYLNKAQTIELLDLLNVNHDGINKFTDLKRMLFNEIPMYYGKRKGKERISFLSLPNRTPG